MLSLDILQTMKAAVEKNCPEIADSLLKQHSELLLTHVPEENAFTWLHLAAARGASDVAGLLLDSGLPIDKVDNNSDTALCIAAGKPWLTSSGTKMVELLLSRGAHPDGSTQQDLSPLHSALVNWTGSGIIAALLKHGASLEIRDYKDRTPLMLAAWHGQIEAITLLLAAGSDVFATGGQNGPDDKNRDWTALDHARHGGELEAAELLDAYMQATLAGLAVDDAVQLSTDGLIRKLQ